MRVLVAGASGAIGRPLVTALLARGYTVISLSRHSVWSSGTPGLTEVSADVLAADDLLRALSGEQADVVVSQLTALKKLPSQHRHMAATNRLRTTGTGNLLMAAKQLGARRFVSQSMMFGYGYDNQGDRLRLETDPFAPRRSGPFEQHLAAMRENEDRVLGDPDVEGLTLRYGLFYGGPASEALLSGVRKRSIPVLGNASPLSMIHVLDAAAATVAAVQSPAAGSAAFNVADDEPVSWTDFVRYVAKEAGAPAPRRVPGWLVGLFAPYAKAILEGGICLSNAKAKDLLGWRPSYPSYRQGVAEMLGPVRVGGHPDE